MDLKKFKKESSLKGVSETHLYLLKKFSSMFGDLKNNYINRLMKKTIHWVTECAKHTTVGGAALEVIAIPSVTADMLVSVVITQEGSVPVSIKTAKCVAGALEITFSADPSNDHEVDYIITRHSS